MTNVTDISTRQQASHRPTLSQRLKQAHVPRAPGSRTKSRLAWALVWTSVASVTAVATAALLKDHPSAAALGALMLVTLTLSRSRTVRAIMTKIEHNWNQKRGRIIAEYGKLVAEPAVVQVLHKRQPRVLASSSAVIPFRGHRSQPMRHFNRPPRIVRPVPPPNTAPFWHHDTDQLAGFRSNGNDNLPPGRR